MRLAAQLDDRLQESKSRGLFALTTTPPQSSKFPPINSAMDQTRGQSMLPFSALPPEAGFMLTSPPTQHIVRLFGWARKYGSLVNLDLHTALGSQNGYNHSVNFLDGVMGYANGRYMLDYIRTLVEFISQHEYKDLIPIFGIVNEAYLPGIGRYVLTSLYAALLPPLLPSAAERVRGAGRGIIQDASTWTVPPKLPQSSFALASMDTTRDLFFSMRKNGPAVERPAAGSAAALATPLPTHIATASMASMAFVTPVAGCTYPDTWSAIGSPVPVVCTETPSR
ncbi:hypothetical protein B0H13DRAFT_2674360 [Mycena leptocephala]|nr:hypothetical protein B0H13DRAFT_2674360 [Mycena leptocephala]